MEQHEGGLKVLDPRSERGMRIAVELERARGDDLARCEEPLRHERLDTRVHAGGFLARMVDDDERPFIVQVACTVGFAHRTCLGARLVRFHAP